jgi:hypothetical protein
MRLGLVTIRAHGHDRMSRVGVDHGLGSNGNPQRLDRVLERLIGRPRKGELDKRSLGPESASPLD